MLIEARYLTNAGDISIAPAINLRCGKGLIIDFYLLWIHGADVAPKAFPGWSQGLNLLPIGQNQKNGMLSAVQYPATLVLYCSWGAAVARLRLFFAVFRASGAKQTR